MVAALAALVLLGSLALAGHLSGPRHPATGAGAELDGRGRLPTRASASARPVPPQANLAPADTEAVLEAYLRFWQVAQTVDSRPGPQWRAALSTVTGQPLLDELLDGLRGQQADGVRQYGTVSPRPAVVDLSPQRATVVDCQDASRSGEVDSDTGAVRKVGSARTPVAAVLRKARGTWLVTEARYLADPC